MPKGDLISIAALSPKKVCIVVGILFIAAGIADLVTGTFKSWTLRQLALHFVPSFIFFVVGILSVIHGIFRKSD